MTSLQALGSGCKAALEIRDKIVRVLEPDGETHQPFGDAGRLEGGCIHLLMGRRGGMDDQRLGVSDVGEMRKELQCLDELRACLAASLQFEAEDCAGPLRQQAFRELVVGMGREFGPQDTADCIVSGEEGDDGAGILDMARHAQRQGFHTLEQVEGVGRAHAGAKSRADLRHGPA